MKKRKRLSPKANRANFQANARKTHYFNMQHRVMRGGIRM